MYQQNQTEVSNETCETWTETAYDWMLRWRRNQSMSLIPTDPSSAAWTFLRPHAEATVTVGDCNNSTRGTGINFIDSVLKRRICSTIQKSEPINTNTIPVISIYGEQGKTWTLISLAARFLVATRPSKFPEYQRKKQHDAFRRSSTSNAAHQNDVPNVIVLDSKHDITICKLIYVIRSTLLRDMSSSNVNEVELKTTFEEDMEDCLSRIHIATISEDPAGWIPILECIRVQLLPLSSVHPTLILWDGYLSEPCWTESIKLNIVRQVEYLLRECTVFMVMTSSSLFRKREWERFVTDRIRLDWKSSKIDTDLSELEAIVNGTIIPFSISSAGILS